ncbi:MAG: FAD-binding oxidoreductase [Gaiellaceae bacterium]
MTETVGLDSERLQQLRAWFTGAILEPGDPGYDEARAVHNGLVDQRPALIARCRTASDIADAINFARASGLEISVRGGGHNVAGRAVRNDALMIDLAEMKGIHVDPVAGRVRAQGGVLWRELNRECAAHGLAVTGGAISTTGIAGFTLGGGLGWLMAKYGIAADNLTSVELVTADGQIADVTADSDRELFWGLRGGGGNFGVAASFEYQVHPLTMVTGGLIAHPVDAAPELLRWYRDAVADASDDLTAFAVLAHAPDGSGLKIAAMAVFHTGPEDVAERELEPFKTWGDPIVVEVHRMPYPIMNTLLDEGYPRGSCNYWLSNFTTGMDDALIDAAVEWFKTVPSPMSAILFEHFHGAVCRVPVDETAVPHREKGFNLVLPSVWLDPADTEANVAWTRETQAALAEHLTERRWLNYLADDQGDDAIRGAYGPNYDRLVELKRRVDPDNVFHHNHNIKP